MNVFVPLKSILYIVQNPFLISFHCYVSLIVVNCHSIWYLIGFNLLVDCESKFTEILRCLNS